MALYDNKLFLLSHIRHSFLLNDETGNSEAVMNGDHFCSNVRRLAKDEGIDTYIESVLDSEEIKVTDGDDPPSFDIRIGMLNSHRQRSNTEIKFEKFRERRLNEPKIKTISWQENSVPLSQEDLEQLFPEKTLEKREDVQKEKDDDKETESEETAPKSLLSFQLANLPAQPENPFTIYQNFDSSNAGPKDRTIMLTVYPKMSDNKDIPMVVRAISTAKIQEVIGLICYKYVLENRKPSLKPHVESYGLHWADETGQVEEDFPPLERKDPINKYGFNVFGLVDLGLSPDTTEEKVVTVFLPDGTFTRLELETKEITMKELMDKSLSRRKISTNPQILYRYNIERKDTPGIPLDPNTILSSLSTDEFYIVRENSKRRSESSNKSGEGRCKNQSGGGTGDIEVYQMFPDVQIFTKVRTKVTVDLGVSEEKVEIYPKRQVSSAKFWAKQKSASYKMEGVVACNILDKKTSGRWIFNLIFITDHGYKKHEFECEEAMAAKIHSKINQILSLHSSNERKKYLESRERKLQRRQSWSFHAK